MQRFEFIGSTPKLLIEKKNQTLNLHKPVTIFVNSCIKFFSLYLAAHSISTMLLNLLGLSNYAAKDYDAASISYPAAGDCAAKYKAAADMISVLVTVLLVYSIII